MEELVILLIKKINCTVSFFSLGNEGTFKNTTGLLFMFSQWM